MKRSKMQINRVNKIIGENERMLKNRLFNLEHIVYSNEEIERRLSFLIYRADNLFLDFRNHYDIEFLCSDESVKETLAPNLFPNTGDTRKIHYMVKLGNLKELKNKIKQYKAELTKRFYDFEILIYKEAYWNSQLIERVFKPALEHLEEKYAEELKRFDEPPKNVAKKEKELTKIIEEC